MRLAVADVEDSASVDEYTVRPGERAAARIGFRTVAPLTSAEHGADRVFLQIDLANDVILGVSHIQAIARPCQPFGSGQLRGPRRTVVARVSLLARPSHVMNRQA